MSEPSATTPEVTAPASTTRSWNAASAPHTEHTAVSRVTIEQIQQTYGERTCQTIIPTNTDIQAAELLQKTVIRHASKSPGATAFRALATELLTILD